MQNDFKDHMLAAMFTGPANRTTENEPCFLVRNEEGKPARMEIYDIIGWPWIEAQDVTRALSEVTADTIHVHINSRGGLVHEGRTIQTALRQHPAKVIAYIDGLCASAATTIALGADEIVMVQGSYFMIHEAWSCACGNAADMVKAGEYLEKLNNGVAYDYVKQTGASMEQVREWMKDETWFSADEALEHGFIDRIDEGEPLLEAWNLSLYNNVPTQLTEAMQAATSGPSGGGEPPLPEAASREHFLRMQNFYEKTEGGR